MTDSYPPVVVPDMSGTVLVDFYGDTTDPQAVHWTKYRVLAWIVSPHQERSGVREFTASADPVLIESHGTTWCYEQRVGDETRWIVPEDCILDTFDAVCEWAHGELAKDRQRLAKRQAVTAAGRT